MERLEVEQALIAVLEEIQRDRGHHNPVVVPSTRPLEDLPGFDSKVAPSATSDLARALDITIPNRTKLFVDPAGHDTLTVAEVAVRVCEIAKASR